MRSLALSRMLNNRINKIHERALYGLYTMMTNHLLMNYLNNSFTIHERNAQALAIEIYKVINGLSPEIMNQVFPLKESNVHSSRFPFKTTNVKSVSMALKH